MKALYQYSFIILCTSVMVMACSRELSYKEALRKNEKDIQDPKRLNDATFLVEAKSFNILESRLTQLASLSGYSSSVVTVAKDNFAEHTAMSKELNDLARKEDIRLPDEMKEEHSAMYDQVATSARGDFDKNFIRTMKAANQENMNKFLGMATGAHDPDIRAFSARKLDMLRTHAGQIENVEKELLQTY